jgi:hypothetical protein
MLARMHRVFSRCYSVLMHDAPASRHVRPLEPIIGSWVVSGALPLTTRRVADLLDPAICRWVAGDRRLLTPVVDRVLYQACRDVLPPVVIKGRRWRADLVRYEPGALPTGELHRSLGHWNSPAQYEVFETVTGTVVLIVATPQGRVTYQVCGPGDLFAVPMGAWHLTYVLDGPAYVFNVYADEHDVPHCKFGRDDAVRCWVRAGTAAPEVRTADDCPVSVSAARPEATARSLVGRQLSEAYADGDLRVFDAIVQDCCSA